MHRLIEFMENYLLRSLIPFLVVLGVGLSALLGTLYCVSVIEGRLGRLTPFDLNVVVLGDAPLWVLLLAGMLIVNGIVMSRAALASAHLGRRQGRLGYEISIPFPLGRLAAANVTYIGASIVVSYLARQLLCTGF